MKPLSLKNVILDSQNSEGHHTEFKSSFGKEVIESVVAFANSDCGKIYLGVNDYAFESISHEFRVSLYQQKLDNHVSEGINLLIEYIKENPNQRVTHIQKALNIPSKRIERWIKKLKNESKVEYKGSNKIGGYFLKDIHD